MEKSTPGKGQFQMDSCTRCPVCQALLPATGPHLRDTLSYHILRGDCLHSPRVGDTLDLSGFFPIDYMAIWHVVRHLPSVKHVYLSVPAVKYRDQLISFLSTFLPGHKSADPVAAEYDRNAKGAFTTVEVKVPIKQKLTKINIKSKTEKFSFALKTKMGKRCSTLETEKPILRSELQNYSLKTPKKEAFIRIVQPTLSKPRVSELMSIPFELLLSGTEIELVLLRNNVLPVKLCIPISLDDCLKRVDVYLDDSEFEEQARGLFLEEAPAYGFGDNMKEFIDSPCVTSAESTSDKELLFSMDDDNTREGPGLEYTDAPAPLNIDEITGRFQRQAGSLSNDYEDSTDIEESEQTVDSAGLSVPAHIITEVVHPTTKQCFELNTSTNLAYDSENDSSDADAISEIDLPPQTGHSAGKDGTSCGSQDNKNISVSESLHFATLSTLERTDTGHDEPARQETNQSVVLTKSALRKQIADNFLGDPRVMKLRNDIEMCVARAYLRRLKSFVTRNEMRLMASTLVPSIESIDGKSINKIERIDGPTLIKRNFNIGLVRDITAHDHDAGSGGEASEQQPQSEKKKLLDMGNHRRSSVTLNMYRSMGLKPVVAVDGTNKIDKFMSKIVRTNNDNTKYIEVVPQHFGTRMRNGRKMVKASAMSNVFIPEMYSLTRDCLPTPPSLCRSFDITQSSSAVSPNAGIGREGFSIQQDLGMCTMMKFHPTQPFAVIGTKTGVFITSVQMPAPQFLSERVIQARQRFPWKIPVSLLVPSSTGQFIPPWVSDIEFLHQHKPSDGTDSFCGLADSNVLAVGDRTGGLSIVSISEMMKVTENCSDADWDELSVRSSRYLKFKKHSSLFRPISSIYNVGCEILDVKRFMSTNDSVDRQVLISGVSTDISLYDIVRQTKVLTFQKAHALPYVRTAVPSMGSSSNGGDVTPTIQHTFMSFGSDSIAKLWDIRAPTEPCAEMYVSKTPIVNVAVSPNTSLVSYASVGCVVGLLDSSMVMHGKSLDLMTIPNIRSHCIRDKPFVSFLNHGKLLAVGSSGTSSIRIFDTATGRISREMCIACSLPLRDLQLGGSGNPVCLGLTSGNNPYKLGIIAGSYSMDLTAPVDVDCICTDLTIAKLI